MIWATLGVLLVAKLGLAAEISRVERSVQGKDNLLNVCEINEFQKKAASIASLFR